MFNKLRTKARHLAAGVVVKTADAAENVAGSDGELTDVKESATAHGAAGLLSDDRAQMGSAGTAVDLVVALVVAGLMAAFLLPIAINEITSVETGTWGDNGAASLWNILPVIIVLSIFLFFVSIAIDRA